MRQPRHPVEGRLVDIHRKLADRTRSIAPDRTLTAAQTTVAKTADQTPLTDIVAPVIDGPKESRAADTIGRRLETVQIHPPLQPQRPEGFSSAASNAISKLSVQTDQKAEPKSSGVPPAEHVPAVSERAESFGQILRPAAGAPVSAPGHPSQLAADAAGQMRVAFSRSMDSTVDLALSPAELGRVRMSIQIHDQIVTLVVTADRPDTADLMRRHMDALAQEFRGMGFAGVSIDVSTGAGGRRRETDDEAGMSGLAESDQTSEIRPEPSLRGVGLLETGLDLKL